MTLRDKNAWYADARLLAAAPEMLDELKRIEQNRSKRLIFRSLHNRSAGP